MFNNLIDFKNKKDRDDFFIALAVILFFAIVFGRFGCSNATDIIEDQVDVATEVVADVSQIDSDNDGIFDDKDNCPLAKGLSIHDGCPFDTDNDGVDDMDDECPKVAGELTNNGCPVAKDSDGDGIVDGKDNCPNVAGIQSNNGCPADADKDGVYDANDKCPNQFGSKSNAGCPEIRIEETERNMLLEAVQSVDFETASASLKANSTKSLDNIATIMKKYPRYKLKIGGHTDAQGDDNKNQVLSFNRAKSCFDYLVAKGVAGNRMSYNGYGETAPIAPNNTKEGMSKNRRVEFDLSF